MQSFIINALIVSCAVSVLFIAIRLYFCYFAKPKTCLGSCTHEDEKDKRLVEMYCGTDTDTIPVTKPKKSRRPKQGAENLGDFALKASDKTKKPRKKRVKEL